MNIKQHLIKIYEKLYDKTTIPRMRLSYRLRIMNAQKTIDYILKNHCSVSRYGEGEFNIMFWTSKIKFQEQNEILANRMREILAYNNKNLLLCVPRTIISCKGYNETAKEWWMDWTKHKQKQVVTRIRKLSKNNTLFGDALMTRPYIDFDSREYSEKMFDRLKQLWNNRDLLIVEGESTCLGIGNDLFSNATSIKRIICPAENAFDKYDNILKSVKKHHRGELVLIALGPTATVLAADLASETCQAIDIGHIDIEYEWFLSGAKEKVAIEGKYTNEVSNGRDITDNRDEKYLSQIIERIN